jgi:dihydroorotate dehydrogenase electron transfer subunit
VHWFNKSGPVRWLVRFHRQGLIRLTQRLVEHFQIEVTRGVLDAFWISGFIRREYSRLLCCLPNRVRTFGVLPTQMQNLLAHDGWTLRDNEARCGSRRITFFHANRVTAALTKALRAIARHDGGRFRHIGVVVASTSAQMHRLRAPQLAGKLPHAFFTSLAELQSPTPPATPATTFTATIVANTPVGPAPHVQYRLVFDAPALGDIRPPQFFMMDVVPSRAGTARAAAPLLKRPFGLCRAYRPNLPADYLRHLALPAPLAFALQPAKAERFDMIYKVLPDGAGTPLMAKLRRGDKVQMLGPLGQPFDVQQLRADGVEEVHVIGGGVGMAPLIMLVETLRYHSFRVKVFIGTATLQSLRHRAAYAYLDDVLAAGVAPADIFLACDRELPAQVRRLPLVNRFHGLVPEQYRRFLTRRPTTDKVVAFTCGPDRMMQLMAEICRPASVRLNVLLEKRMGCGFGVCFSCVQKVRRADGSEEYARVCREGPVFDAKTILWNNDSKPNSAGCGCAARC